ncbi:dockerin type I repeat-containing protein [Ruminococcus albus]|uniref:Dockerin domain-containing protein n=1 Tax=Ruminococcus albus (strain ATCC 27210 / DSM 20455 / JCM 14654 / NCDO 2250 / 7) TaxID=697329 RepID=E6UK81_RUMA7|nr:dockerin type I repeat-containing protein [Ruminococcus albus]ADU24077.1 hypothetical protein Rumal_3638 [Ruminococcus albus 7 = DSM 20455]
MKIIAQKTLTIYVNSSYAIYGQTLADVTLPTADDGTWAWEDDTLSVGDVGNNTFAATYTPEDTDNYNTLSQDLTVTLLGDINFDGKINVTDIVKIAAHIKGKKILDKTAARAADVNGDSSIDVTDIIMIAAHIKGKKLL